MKKLTVYSLITYIILILLSAVCVLPLIMVISISLSSESAIAEYGYTLLPKVISFEAYKQAFANPWQLVNSYKTTVAYSIIGTVLALLVQSMAAYSLSRKIFKYRKPITIYLFITMLFSGGLVPQYIINTQYLRLNDSFWIYIFPSLVSVWNLIIIRTFFQNLPTELVEAAKIDGASEFRIYGQIIMPLSKPVLATIGFMTLLVKWNDWNTALIYIRNPSLYSLQYLLQRLLREAEFINNMAQTASAGLINTADLPTESLRFTMAVLASGPMLLVFPFFQKYFTKGLTVGAVKG